MAHIHSRFARRRRITSEIPTASTADIAFLLIIFFMVSTVFAVYRGFPVDLPAASKIDALMSRRNVVNIWVSPTGRIMVDEFETNLSNVGNIVRKKLAENPRTVVLIKSDRNTEYRMISGLIGELKKADALRVSFIARKER
jgi:biopolymer transport protein ExbD